MCACLHTHKHTCVHAHAHIHTHTYTEQQDELLNLFVYFKLSGCVTQADLKLLIQSWYYRCKPSSQGGQRSNVLISKLLCLCVNSRGGEGMNRVGHFVKSGSPVVRRKMTQSNANYLNTPQKGGCV